MLRDLDMTIERAPVAIVDVETTGLMAAFGDRVCEIAVLRCERGQEVGRFESLVNPERRISPAAARVNGLSDALVGRAPRFAEVVGVVEALADGAVLVAHNAPFDLSFLSAEWNRLRRPPLANPVVDTLALARRWYAFPSNNLGQISRRFGLYPTHEHRAMADVQMTRHIFDRMVADLRQRGLTTVADFIGAQGGNIRFERALPPDLPSPLIEALQTGSRLRIRYADRDGVLSERAIDVIQVSGTYVVAYCHLRHDQRSFRIDRIMEMWLDGDL
jgi:DNA polymerase III epsilon subunit family exonuclease